MRRRSRPLSRFHAMRRLAFTGALVAAALMVAPGGALGASVAGGAGGANVNWLPEVEGAERVVVPRDGLQLVGYLFRPEVGHEPAPAVVILHDAFGGSWQMANFARSLASEGYVTLALSMRGSSGSDGVASCGARDPADVAEAVAWLGGLEGVDPTRMGVVGISEGGRVALMAAARSHLVRSVVAFSPETDMVRLRATTQFYGIPEYIDTACAPFGLSNISPANFAPSIHASVLLVHGDDDIRVPAEQSVLMYEALESAGKIADVRFLRGAGHTYREQDWALAWPWTLQHLKKTLRAR